MSQTMDGKLKPGGLKTRSPVPSPCSASSLLIGVALVVVSVTCTRLWDFGYGICSRVPNGGFRESSVPTDGGYQRFGTLDDAFGMQAWPAWGYGTELALRVYVYDESVVAGLKALLSGRNHLIEPTSCENGQWGTQVKIHKLLLTSKYRTLDKDKANLFFVPMYIKCVRMKGGLSDREINDTIVQVLQQMPYFRRSGGRDHVFVFPSGAGAHLFKDWSIFLNRSIFLSPEGDRTDKRGFSAFNTWKDIIIPGNIDNGIPIRNSSIHQVLKPISLARRKFLANFLGRAQGKDGRLKLLELGKQFPDELDAPALELTGPMKLQQREYLERLRHAKFCLAPRGESSWTLRFYESFFVECVPVILSDQIELPFQDVLDYGHFSIKWPASRIDRSLLQYLASIPDSVIERMIRRGRQVRCLWVYLPETEGCSAMIGILWELQRKVRAFHQSAETFWLHNGAIVDRNLHSIQSWQFPLPLP